jgi:NAD(P)-dependent dehydrogenase (short-subunit alcohol dehydrogenase family)
MSSRLVAVVAGVDRGTGSAITHKFASQYPVVCLARNPESYEKAVSNINKSGGNTIGVTTDLSNAKSVKSSFDRLEMELGGDFKISVGLDITRSAELSYFCLLIPF